VRKFFGFGSSEKPPKLSNERPVFMTKVQVNALTDRGTANSTERYKITGSVNPLYRGPNNISIGDSKPSELTNTQNTKKASQPPSVESDLKPVYSTNPNAEEEPIYGDSPQSNGPEYASVGPTKPYGSVEYENPIVNNGEEEFTEIGLGNNNSGGGYASIPEAPKKPASKNKLTPEQILGYKQRKHTLRTSRVAALFNRVIKGATGGTVSTGANAKRKTGKQKLIAKILSDSGRATV
jgi:hypothetical protein